MPGVRRSRAAYVSPDKEEHNKNIVNTDLSDQAGWVAPCRCAQTRASALLEKGDCADMGVNVAVTHLCESPAARSRADRVGGCALMRVRTFVVRLCESTDRTPHIEAHGNWTDGRRSNGCRRRSREVAGNGADADLVGFPTRKVALTSPEVADLENSRPCPAGSSSGAPQHQVQSDRAI